MEDPFQNRQKMPLRIPLYRREVRMKKLFNIAVLFLIFMSSAHSISAEAAKESVVVLGGGIGALTSALYLARAGLEPLVVEGGTPGGLLTQSHLVQNWPGEMAIEGQALIEKVRAQAEASGARFLEAEAISVDFSKKPFVLTVQSFGSKPQQRQIFMHSCIIAMGTTPNYLGVAGEQTYWGKGVTNCAICDGSLYREQIVGVVGGGDAAVIEALYLANIAKEVHVFVRKDTLRANETQRIAALLERPNVTFHYNTEVVEVKGDAQGLAGVVLKQGAKLHDFRLNGLFLAIGSRPNTQIFRNTLELDKQGYIVLKKDQETSIPGVYAIGDIVDPVYKQAISAAGDGAKAALQTQQFLTDQLPGLVALKKGIGKNNPKQGQVVEITESEQFERELKHTNSPVVVDFYATWCGPCKKISSELESRAQQLSGKVKFLKVNVDKLGDLSRSYQIRAMPTVLLFDNKGKVVERKVGIDQIVNFLEQLGSSL